jgi:plasmid stabilization system protein ParE
MAERGRVVPELEEPTIRELIVGSHRLIYEIDGADVNILGLIHGARDLAALWDKGSHSGPGAR